MSGGVPVRHSAESSYGYRNLTLSVSRGLTGCTERPKKERNYKSTQDLAIPRQSPP